MKPANFFARSIPQLGVKDVAEAQAYYRDVLGFKIDWIWGENDYGAVSRDEMAVYLTRWDCPISPSWNVVNVREVDGLCAEWKSRGANILSEPEDKPWGLREFTLQDLNGHCFRLSKPVNPAPPKSLARLAVKYAHRLPTWEEYTNLIQAVQWEGFTNFDAARQSLAQSRFCVVAELNGEFVGMARLCGDGAQFFYLMDVAVLPNFQHSGVGTGLMNEIVRFLQNQAPEKSLLTLFTSEARSSFYKRFGFEGPETWLYGMSAKQLRVVE